VAAVPVGDTLAEASRGGGTGAALPVVRPDRVVVTGASRPGGGVVGEVVDFVVLADGVMLRGVVLAGGVLAGGVVTGGVVTGGVVAAGVLAGRVLPADPASSSALPEGACDGGVPPVARRAGAPRGACPTRAAEGGAVGTGAGRSFERARVPGRSGSEDEDCRAP
jgi:hypothetical protein